MSTLLDRALLHLCPSFSYLGHVEAFESESADNLVSEVEGSPYDAEMQGDNRNLS